MCSLARRHFSKCSWSSLSRLTGRKHMPRRCLCTRPEEMNLMRHLTARINASGPLPVAEYMKEVLINPLAGYYINKEVFGDKGDYITSPEICQMFGELIGIWCINEWHMMGKPSKIQVVELGPGRGTLAADMMKVFSQFEEFKNAVSMHLVEISPSMMQRQITTLTDAPAPNMDALNLNFTLKSKYGPDVTWCRFLDEVPKECSCFIAHEFFDALPVYKFQKCDGIWHEVMVDVNKEGNGLRFVLSPGPTTNTASYLQHISESDTREHVEVCPEGGAIVQRLANRISNHGGRALIADYGHDGTKSDTFRAFRNHQAIDPLKDPSSADLTADVDFAYLQHCCKDIATTYGPVSQKDFLNGMGIGVRLQMLLRNADPKSKSNLMSSVRRLMHPEQMGEIYKFFAVFPQDTEDYLPPGFSACQTKQDIQSRPTDNAKPS